MKQELLNELIAVVENEGLSWRAAGKLLGIKKSTASDALRRHYGGFGGLPATTVAPKEQKQVKEAIRSPQANVVRGKDREFGVDNSRILVISDMHIPYHHVDLLAFLTHLKNKYNPTRVICMGDELDKHALSYHDSDPDLASAGDELRKALPIIQELYKMFPQMDILESNHGSLVWRKAKTNGIPKHYIKSYNEVLGVGDGWKWYYDLTIKLPSGASCYFHHGKSNDVKNLSQLMGMCAVQGHYHESFKIDYWGNPNGLFWGMQTACLIDDSSLAFSYNNVNVKRPVIGTGVIINGHPILEPMILDEDGGWQGAK